MALPKKARRELRRLATEFGVLDPLWFKDMRLDPPEPPSLDLSLLDLVQAIAASGLLLPKPPSDDHPHEEEPKDQQLPLRFGT